jgi:hypothetical protein
MEPEEILTTAQVQERIVAAELAAAEQTKAALEIQHRQELEHKLKEADAVRTQEREELTRRLSQLERKSAVQAEQIARHQRLGANGEFDFKNINRPGGRESFQELRTTALKDDAEGAAARRSLGYDPRKSRVK